MTPNNAEPKVVYEGKYQRMVVRGSWEYSERVHAGGLAAIIIAVTPEVTSGRGCADARRQRTASAR